MQNIHAKYSCLLTAFSSSIYQYESLDLNNELIEHRKNIILIDYCVGVLSGGCCSKRLISGFVWGLLQQPVDVGISSECGE